MAKRFQSWLSAFGVRLKEDGYWSQPKMIRDAFTKREWSDGAARCEAMMRGECVTVRRAKDGK